LIFLVVWFVALPAWANPIDDAVAAMDDGRIYLEYASREGVYGDGHNIITRGDHDYACDCEEGPARVRIRVRHGETRDLKVLVGGRWRGVRETDVDLGEVPVAAAREYFLELAQTARQSVAEDAVFALSLADDDTIWRDVLALARDRSLGGEVRSSAVFWMGQFAAEAATAGLEDIIDDEDDDIEVRESAVFALSQRPDDESVPALTRLAQSHEHPRIRRTAIFWLSQHDDDPRVIDLFEDLLLRN
jgi:HEAT repeat protein